MLKLCIAALGTVSAIALSASAPAATPGTVAFKTIYSFVGNVSGFSKDGAYPESAMVLLGSTLYGAGVRGGKYDNGTFFAYDLTAGTEKTVYSFNVDPNADSVRKAAKAPMNYPQQEALWITTAANKFVYADYNQQQLRYKTKTGGKSLCLFGADESMDVNSALAVQVGSTLITNQSAGGYGALVTLDRETCASTSLYTFTDGTDGGDPNGPLVYTGGLIYGTTEVGGASDNGVVFTYDPASAKFKVIYTFTGGNDGTNPTGLILAGGLLYGTTNYGGASGFGTVFSIDPASGAEKTVYAFLGGADGTYPAAPLIHVGGFLYGTATGGGEDNDGTIFKVDIKSGRETTLHSFTFTDGSLPIAPLTHYNGVFYGTTIEGGLINEGSPYGAGTIFQFTE